MTCCCYSRGECEGTVSGSIPLPVVSTCLSTGCRLLNTSCVISCVKLRKIYCGSVRTIRTSSCQNTCFACSRFSGCLVAVAVTSRICVILLVATVLTYSTVVLSVTFLGTGRLNYLGRIGMRKLFNFLCVGIRAVRASVGSNACRFTSCCGSYL